MKPKKETKAPARKLSQGNNKSTASTKPKAEPEPISIVGIGASAGGLEAFEQFFAHVPPDIGMAFVLISHLDPGHASMMSELLRRVTKLKVDEAQDGVHVEPNHVYVIPPQ